MAPHAAATLHRPDAMPAKPVPPPMITGSGVDGGPSSLLSFVAAAPKRKTSISGRSDVAALAAAFAVA